MTSCGFAIAGAVVLLLMLMAVSSASASEKEWLLNGEPVTSATTVKSKGTVALVDMGAKSKITCEGTDEGTVGPGTLGLVTKITATKCTQQEGTCETSRPITAKAIHLPWLTRIFSVGGEVRDLIEPSESGEPGYVVECTVLGIFKITDECFGMTSAVTENSVGGVDFEFESVSNEEAAHCSVGGANTGLVEGTDLNESPPGNVLTVGKVPVVDATPSQLDFEGVKARESASESIKFQNLGPGSWNPSSAKILIGAETFEIASDSCDEPIAVNAECSVEIKFEPHRAGHSF